MDRITQGGWFRDKISKIIKSVNKNCRSRAYILLNILMVSQDKSDVERDKLIEENKIISKNNVLQGLYFIPAR